MGIFDSGIEDALATVWSNIYTTVTDTIPGWLLFIFAQPANVWVGVILGIAIGYVLGKWGPLALGVLGAALIAVFTLGQNSRKK